MAPGARSVVLPDGRRLAYDEHGDPAGSPVLYFHGTPSSRLDALALAGAAGPAGVRLVALDRPGIGRSDPRGPWRVADWPADAAALADALGLRHFGVCGWSGGGAYALACAEALPGRVTRAALVACAAPPEADRAGMSVADRTLEALSRRAPVAARLVLGVAAAVARRQRSLARRSFGLGLPAADRAALARAPAAFRDLGFFLEAFRQGARGPVLDYRALAIPWDFAPEDVGIPVTLWQGEADPIVPPGHGEHLTARLPRAELRRCPGEGHLLGLAHAREVLEAAGGPGKTRRPPERQV